MFLFNYNRETREHIIYAQHQQEKRTFLGTVGLLGPLPIITPKGDHAPDSNTFSFSCVQTLFYKNWIIQYVFSYVAFVPLKIILWIYQCGCIVLCSLTVLYTTPLPKYTTVFICFFYCLVGCLPLGDYYVYDFYGHFCTCHLETIHVHICCIFPSETGPNT